MSTGRCLWRAIKTVCVISDDSVQLMPNASELLIGSNERRNMRSQDNPFPLSSQPKEIYDGVLRYWSNLKRGDNEIPFSDDLDPTQLAQWSEQLFLVEVFDMPQRFRFNAVGQLTKQLFGLNIVGKFLADLDVRTPLEFMSAQASATIEAGAPTYFRAGPGCLNRFSASISGASAGVRLPSGLAAG